MAHPSPSTTADSRQHFDALDSLRGLAALCVVLAHVPRFGAVYNTHFVYNGYLMVDFFFVLSGFVITYAYGDKLRSATDVRRFVWLRFWRLYPLHFSMLMVALALELAKFAAQAHAGIVPVERAFSVNTPGAFSANLLLLQFLWKEPTFDGPSWSIGVEFYVYMTFALVALLLRTRLRLAVCAIAISLASLSVFRQLGDDHSPFIFHLSLFRCTFGFFAGVVTFEIYRRLKSIPWLANNGGMDWLAVAVIAAYVVFLSLKSPGYSDLGATGFASLIILTMALAPRTGPTKILVTRPFLWLGSISYSIYMVHIFVITVVTAVLKFVLHIRIQGIFADVSSGPGTLLLLLVVGIVLAFSHITFTFIEKPMRNWSKLTGWGVRTAASQASGRPR